MQKLRTGFQARKPQTWRYVGAAIVAVGVVLAYAYASWSITHPFSWLPKSLSAEIAWVSGDSKIAAANDTKENASSIEHEGQELRAKLLDFRGKLGDSFGPVNALLSSLGFIALLYSINMQRSSSAEQERLQQRQQFEALLSLTVQANREALREIGSLSWDPDHSYVPTKKEKFAYGDDYRRLKLSNRWTGKEALHRVWNDEIDSLFSEEIKALIDNTLATEITKQFSVLATYDENSTTDAQKMAVPNVELVFDQIVQHSFCKLFLIGRRAKRATPWNSGTEFHWRSSLPKQRPIQKETAR